MRGGRPWIETEVAGPGGPVQQKRSGERDGPVRVDLKGRIALMRLNRKFETVYIVCVLSSFAHDSFPPQGCFNSKLLHCLRKLKAYMQHETFVQMNAERDWLTR